jgi:2-C-methyl-D-erythritol 2,4-cyclodiphosphate synthase
MARIGFGYDSHRFAQGRALVLGGVVVEHSAGLAGHSDADAVLHALTDAILGAIAAGDIGEHFPDSDPRWAGASSEQFVRHALSLAKARHLRVVNCDITILTELPKLKAYKAGMGANIARMLGVSADDVSIKAKTNEGMGWVGRGEGLAAMAIVLLDDE